MGERYFPIQVSKGPMLLYAGLIAAPLIAAGLLVNMSDPVPAMILLTTTLLMVAIYSSAFRVRYEVDGREIRLRQGIFTTWRIQIADINRVLPAKGPVVGSIKTVDCLMIQAGKRQRLVAAPDLESFMIELAARAPHLRRYGEELRGDIGT